jgi:hypothetical protein
MKLFERDFAATVRSRKTRGLETDFSAFPLRRMNVSRAMAYQWKSFPTRFQNRSRCFGNPDGQKEAAFEMLT